MDITQDEGLPIERVDEGQNKGVIRQIAKEVASILTENEKMLYIAHQGKTVFGQKRDAVIATNNRMIIFKRQRFRGFVFDDFLWEDVKDVDIDQWMLSATIKCTLTDGELLYVPGLVKAQARVVYAICQQKEQEWRERRRVRQMEEDRAKAGGTEINMPSNGAESAASDPVERLAKAKTMFDEELISEAEYETLKANILSDV